MPNQTERKSWIRRLPRWRLAVAGVALVVLGAFLLKRKPDGEFGSTFAARKGTLQINVLESGSIEAQEFQEVRSEVKGHQGTKILSIVEEGYLVTEDDVKNGKVLVELDSSELKQRIVTQDIEYQARRAALTEAQQGFEIQLAQNKSEIKAAEQKARFALLDFEKYLGDKTSDEIISRIGLVMPPQMAQITEADLTPAAVPPAAAQGPGRPPGPGGAQPTLVAAISSPGALNGGAPDVKLAASGPPPTVIAPPPTQRAPPPKSEPPLPSLFERTNVVVIDFSDYAKVDLLGDGEAQQKLREAKDGLLLAEKEKGSSDTKLAGTQRLFEKGFVTKIELDTAKLEFEQVDLKVKKAGTALNLFIKYEFVKMAEELLSKYEEALRSLERTRKEAISKLAQAHAKRMSAESQFSIVEKARTELQEQVDKCVIKAMKPGLVIYGGSGDGMYFYGEERIREGALIRERQPIITIPDTTRMSVKVKIPESHIKKVKKGMKARILVEAFPDEKLTGEVIKVGVLPDAQNRWMNPDMKLYVTTVSIDGTHSWLKPGMTAKVEVQVNELKDVVYVPIQAISVNGTDQVCYLVNGSKPERRTVEVGDFTDEFIEIKSGLKEGEKVYLRAPEAPDQDQEKKEEDTKPAPTSPSPAPGPAPGPSSPVRKA